MSAASSRFLGLASQPLPWRTTGEAGDHHAAHDEVADKPQPSEEGVGDDIVPGGRPKAAGRALLLMALNIALGHLGRLAARRALRAQPRVALGTTAAWTLGSVAFGIHRFRARRRALHRGAAQPG